MQALNAERVKVEEGIFLQKGFTAYGEVRFVGAKIGGDLACVGGAFFNVGGRALTADGMRVGGSVFMRKINEFYGEARFIAVEVKNHFQWRKNGKLDKAMLDLRDARIGTIWIGEEDKPERDQCFLHGLVYESFNEQMPSNAQWWIDFIERQTTELPESREQPENEKPKTEQPETKDQESGSKPKRRLFLPQPYEQAAKVLRAHGHAEEAREVLIAKERRRGASMRFRDIWEKTRGSAWTDRLLRGLSLAVEWAWYRSFAKLIGYGYRPSLAFFLAILWVSFGACLFWLGSGRGLMTPLQETPAVPFQPFIYSVETFTPLIPLRQADFWLPDANITPWGYALRWFVWFHTALGWITTTLLVAALTGLLRR